MNILKELVGNVIYTKTYGNLKVKEFHENKASNKITIYLKTQHETLLVNSYALPDIFNLVNLVGGDVIAEKTDEPPTYNT